MPERQIELLKSEAGLNALFKFASIGIVAVGKTGCIEFVNPCAEKLFGYENADLIGQALSVLIPDTLCQKHVHHREGCFEEPNAGTMGLGIELYAKKKDGKIFPVDISLGNYEVEGEMMAVTFVTDLTARKQAEQESEKAKEDLENRVKERTLELTAALKREKDLGEIKTKSVSMASHEFRTPLSSVLSSAFLIEQYPLTEQKEKRQKHVDRIKSSVNNLTEILNDFLSLDKIEQGKVEIQREVFNLEDFAEDVLEEVKSNLKAGQFINHDHNGEKNICQDKKILRNVLLNLLSNACKYSGENEEIHFNTHVCNKMVSIKIKNNGIGIPEEEQKNLFEKFYRAKNVVNIQGTGLGLNIVKRYVELMGGGIGFTSKVDEETVFAVDFPQNISE